ncbi:hypothetical protein KGF56_002354 [Candida oxycetoniae]|uniref:5'-deoxynucleotidase n=1 Tax=Candida oxycetoniae TaxID=497107 RepID=A0AAI9SXJ3_9ASCO|nr:uncharacterized protein KGF56_002354 [Candida oxycetoniae]KAI3404837.2 hypothetical protein KGF56_002354 [Candida oxycetoniae]
MTSINNLSENTWKPEDAVPQSIKNLLAQESHSVEKSSSINLFLAFLQIISSLKFQPRTGWIDSGIPLVEAESIADHMYRMAIISMIVPPPNINKDKCVKIAIVHDLAECLVGDITPFSGIAQQEKHRRELETINYICEFVKPYNAEFAHEMRELWTDYEEIRTPEARYVKDIDKFEMIQMAWEYELKYGLKYDIGQFYRARSAVKTKEVGELCDAILQKREAFIEKLEKKEEKKG